jgi:PiT family inorganic phosphate transporter
VEIIALHGTVFVGMAVVFGLYMCWGIGANDVANAMGTSVGSGAISVRQAIVIAAIFEFAGAFLAGGHVTTTIRKGIIDPTLIADEPELLIFGMLASLLAAGIWLMVASRRGWPVSTTHTIVGAIVGFGLVGIGPEAVNWGKILQIAASWVVSPVVGGLIAFLLMISIHRLILEQEKPFEAGKRWGPMYIFLVGFVITLVTSFKGLKHLDLEFSVGMSVLVSTVVGLMTAAIGWYLMSKIEIDPVADKDFHFASLERVFAPAMIFTACAMAFAHGSNDVANGIGPMAAVVSIVKSSGDITQKADLPLWILVVGGVGIIVGLSTLGYQVMKTIGKDITALTPTRGFCATLAAASTVVVASRTGLPVSTTHIAVGAVIGVGLARGLGAIDLRVVGTIIVSWLVTLPVGATLAAFFFFTLKGMFSG